MRRTSSGSSCSARPVKPTRSAKSTVTTLRSSRIGGWFSPGSNAPPHAVQKGRPRATTSPHVAQARPSWTPQLPQNSAPGRVSKLQDAHSAMTRTSVGRLQAENAPRPGLAEVIAVWTGFGLLALAILVTYARLPLDELYNVSGTGFEAGAGRVLVFAGYPTALV